MYEMPSLTISGVVCPRWGLSQIVGVSWVPQPTINYSFKQNENMDKITNFGSKRLA